MHDRVVSLPKCDSILSSLVQYPVATQKVKVENRNLYLFDVNATEKEPISYAKHEKNSCKEDEELQIVCSRAELEVRSR